MKNRFPFTLEIKSYIRDHHFDGKAIYPAVESLAVLASAVARRHTQANLHILSDAQFPRMLAVPETTDCYDMQIEMESADSGVTASLQTAIVTKSGAMTRFLEHARVTFTQNMILPDPDISFPMIQNLEGDCIPVPSGSIYRELIPFGSSYQNITGDLSVSEKGALAVISGGGGEANDSVLGSPFVLDATMHAACVWGQRFCGIVSFPIGFDRRIIYNATRKGESYFARIVPVTVSREPFVFDAWIFDQNGIMCESIRGLRMRDVTQGRMQPPQWIRVGACKKLS